MRNTLSDEEMARRKIEHDARLAAIEAARSAASTSNSDEALSARIYRAGGYVGDSKTKGAPWSARGMGYARSQRKGGRPSNAQVAGRSHFRQTMRVLRGKRQGLVPSDPIITTDRATLDNLVLVDCIDRAPWTPVHREHE